MSNLYENAPKEFYENQTAEERLSYISTLIEKRDDNYTVNNFLDLLKDIAALPCKSEYDLMNEIIYCTKIGSLNNVMHMIYEAKNDHKTCACCLISERDKKIVTDYCKEHNITMVLMVYHEKLDFSHYIFAWGDDCYARNH